MAQKKDKTILGIIVFLAAIAIISGLAILFGKDDYNGVEVSGLDLIPQLYPSFWIWVTIGVLAGGFFGYLSYVTYKGIGIGRNIRGELTYVWFAAIACILIAAPWGYLGGAKANGGFVLPKQQAQFNVPMIDTLICRGWQREDVRWANTIDTQEFKEFWEHESRKMNNQ
jgi:hypothetical protein